MARNDPTDTGGLFIGRRPGTAPVRLRAQPEDHRPSRRRRRFDEGLAALIFACQVILCLSLWGPQPAAGLWVGSMVDYLTGSVVLGILIAFILIMAMLGVTLIILRRLDYVWKLVRRAAGHEQPRGVLERIFVTTAVVAGAIFLFWFFVISGPGSMVVPERPR
jgi:amino acid transporter